MTTYSATTVSSGATLLVNSGDSAENVTVQSGGILDILSGGTGSATQVASGGIEAVYAGATETSATINGGALSVYGSASDITVMSGGNEIVSGTDDGSNATTSGVITIASGGFGSDESSQSGGIISVSSGGNESRATIDQGGYLIITGDTATGSSNTVNISGTMDVLSGATDTASTNNGGLIYAEAATLTNETTAGGVEWLTHGSTAQNDTASQYSMVIVDSSTTIGESLTSNSTMSISATGQASGTSVDASSTETLAGHDNSGTIAGTLHVLSGGVAANDTLIDNGIAVIDNGASATGISVGSDASLYDNGSVSGATIAGEETINAGGYDQGATIVAGGSAFVSSGAIMASATVQSGGSVYLTSGTITGLTEQAGAYVNIDGGTIRTTGSALAAGSTIQIGGNGSPSTTRNTIAISDAPGAGQTEDIGATITGWSDETSKIDLTAAGTDLGNATLTVSGSALTVHTDNGNYVLHFGDSISANSFQLASDGRNGLAVVCFLPDTLIATPAGEIPVRDITAGSTVLTSRNGATLACRVTMVGRKRVDTLKSPHEAPVRIRRDAIDDGIPARDLLVTPEHCIALRDHLIPARMLVNGRSITIDTTIETYECHHVELAQHSLMLAEGLQAESYLDTGNSHQFSATETWEGGRAVRQNPVLPIISDTGLAEEIWKGLVARADRLGLPPAPTARTTRTDDPNLMVIRDNGRCSAPSRQPDGTLCIPLEQGVTKIALASRNARPADVYGPYFDDRRSLGVKIASLRLSDQEIELTGDEMPGWHGTEPDGRWTNGLAVVTLPRAARADEMLTITITGTMSYAIETTTAPAVAHEPA